MEGFCRDALEKVRETEENRRLTEVFLRDVEGLRRDAPEKVRKAEENGASRTFWSATYPKIPFAAP